MIEEYQPDPDELLKAIQREEDLHTLGKLKIFFGMSAGVGKTYSMLEEAQRRLKEGVNIIVGTINTHGRKDTENLLQGLPIIPEKWVRYRDTVFEEMDLETILLQKPSIVLVDELAHTNVPGSRHSKRWQDVIEILDAGIDVYTTLNVQHVESRKDMIENITGIQIRETVPDLILERASSIELIDLSPSELLLRLKEGKVYLGNQSQVAAQNFFKEDKLMALREIALRFTAEKVDHDLHKMLSQSQGWKTREKLMVAVSPSPFSQQLIRTTRRRAFELDAPWIALYVDTGTTLSDQEQTRLTNHLNLAQELGAEVITTYDFDIAAGLQRIARQKNITQVVIGRPASRNFFQNLFKKSLIDRLEEENKQLDLLILRQDRLTKVYQDIHLSLTPKGSLRDYGITLATMGGLIGLGFLLDPFIGYKSVGFIFLLGILVLSFFVQQGSIFLAAFLSTLSWNYLFIPPIFSFTIKNPQDLALMSIYFCTAAAIGILTSRIRKQDFLLQLRAKKIAHLYEIEREIANASNFQYLRINVTLRLQSIFPGTFDILIKGQDQQLIFDSKLLPLQNEKEQGVAHWVFQNGKIAGWSTSTLPAAKGLYLPIKFSKSTLGVLIYYPQRERLLSMDEMNFLQTVSQQIGIYLERYLFEERVLNQSYTTQVEKLHTALLHSLTSGLEMPLNKIMESTQQLQTLPTNMPASNQLLQTIDQTIYKLKFIVDNSISLAELESGFVHLEKQKIDIQDFVEQSVKEIEPLLKGHLILFSFANVPCFLSFDSRLMKVALKNLLIYAMLSSQPNRPITIEGKEENHSFKISIVNEGSKIPEEVLSLLFNKIYQPPKNISEKEIKPNLAIAKSILDIHQGSLEAHNREQGTGAILSLTLPL